MFLPYPTSESKYQRLGHGLIAVRGYYASVRTSTYRALVNINVQTSAFYPTIDVHRLIEDHGDKGDQLERFEITSQSQLLQKQARQKRG